MNKNKSNKISPKENQNKIKNKKILLLSNTSRYIFQYRLLLLKTLRNSCKELFILAPFDKTSKLFNRFAEFREWKLQEKNNYSLNNFIKSFIQLFINIKEIRPDIVHSHTLKANLLISLINFFLVLILLFLFCGNGKIIKF